MMSSYVHLQHAQRRARDPARLEQAARGAARPLRPRAAMTHLPFAIPRRPGCCGRHGCPGDRVSRAPVAYASPPARGMPRRASDSAARETARRPRQLQTPRGETRRGRHACGARTRRLGLSVGPNVAHVWNTGFWERRAGVRVCCNKVVQVQEREALPPPHRHNVFIHADHLLGRRAGRPRTSRVRGNVGQLCHHRSQDPRARAV
jgi:hypothetical protein